MIALSSMFLITIIRINRYEPLPPKSLTKEVGCALDRTSCGVCSLPEMSIHSYPVFHDGIPRLTICFPSHMIDGMTINSIIVTIRAGMITHMDGELGYALPNGTWRLEVVPHADQQGQSKAGLKGKVSYEPTPEPPTPAQPDPLACCRHCKHEPLTPNRSHQLTCSICEAELSSTDSPITVSSRELVKGSYEMEAQGDYPRANLNMLRALYQQEEEHMAEIQSRRAHTKPQPQPTAPPTLDVRPPSRPIMGSDGRDHEY